MKGPPLYGLLNDFFLAVTQTPRPGRFPLMSGTALPCGDNTKRRRKGLSFLARSTMQVLTGTLSMPLVRLPLDEKSSPEISSTGSSSEPFCSGSASLAPSSGPTGALSEPALLCFLCPRSPPPLACSAGGVGVSDRPALTRALRINSSILGLLRLKLWRTPDAVFVLPMRPFLPSRERSSSVGSARSQLF